MLRAIPFANAFGAVSGVFYLIGALIAMAAPGFYLALLQSWFMLSFSVAAIGTIVTFAGFIVGLVTTIVAGWLFGAALAVVYNALAQAQGAVR